RWRTRRSGRRSRRGGSARFAPRSASCPSAPSYTTTSIPRATLSTRTDGAQGAVPPPRFTFRLLPPAHAARGKPCVSAWRSRIPRQFPDAPENLPKESQRRAPGPRAPVPPGTACAPAGRAASEALILANQRTDLRLKLAGGAQGLVAGALEAERFEHEDRAPGAGGR